MKVLVLPGIGNSGADHWQSHWEKENRNYIRVNQDNWNSPHCAGQDHEISFIAKM